MLKKNTDTLHILLADDDEDDRAFFTDALNGSKLNTELDTVHDGDELLTYLNAEDVKLPDVIFLDMNMPKKNGMECLVEIRGNTRLRNIAVAIYSTSSNSAEVDDAFVKGANIYINKTPDFEKLKEIILEVLDLNWQYCFEAKLDRGYFLLVR